MPEFKNLDKDYVICSHAFINTINFSKDERIRIDFSVDKKILIERFKQRENILENRPCIYYFAKGRRQKNR